MSAYPDCRFERVESEPNTPPLQDDGPGPTRYRGICQCGHPFPWTTDKDAAWEELTGHLLPAIISEFWEAHRRD